MITYCLDIDRREQRASDQETKLSSDADFWAVVSPPDFRLNFAAPEAPPAPQPPVQPSAPPTPGPPEPDPFTRPDTFPRPDDPPPCRPGEKVPTCAA